MERTPLCKVASPMRSKEGSVLWLFMSALLVEVTSAEKSTVKSGRQFWAGAFGLESGYLPREN